MGKSIVSVIKATPETVLDDIAKAMRESGYQNALRSDADT
jgi:hypothetical protein